MHRVMWDLDTIVEKLAAQWQDLVVELPPLAGEEELNEAIIRGQIVRVKNTLYVKATRPLLGFPIVTCTGTRANPDQTRVQTADYETPLPVQQSTVYTDDTPWNSPEFKGACFNIQHVCCVSGT